MRRRAEAWRTLVAPPIVAALAVGLVLGACGTMVDRSASVDASGPSAEEQTSEGTTGRESTDSAPGRDASEAGQIGGGTNAGPGAVDESGAEVPTNELNSGLTVRGTPIQGVDENEIRIGLTAPVSGLFGEIIGEELVGPLDAYFKDLNERGGIDGRQVRLIVYDDALDLGRTLTNARRLWEEDKVALLLTTFPDGVADYVTRNRIPTLVLGFSASAFSSFYPTIFPILQSGASATYSFTYGLKESGVPTEGMRVGMLYDTQIIDTRPYLDSARDAWDLVGSEVVAAEPFNFADGDCTSLVVKMRDLDIDWWDFEGLGWSLCVSAAQRQQYQPNIAWGNWPTNIGYLAQYAGPHVDGVWFMAPADENSGYPRERTQEHEAYKQTLQRYHPTLTEPVHLNSVVTQTFWIAARVIDAAFSAVIDNPTQDALIEWLQSIDNFDTGIAPPLESWSPDCKVGVNTIWIGVWRWKDGGPVREPKSGYLSNPFAREKYGECFVTALADSAIRD